MLFYRICSSSADGYYDLGNIYRTFSSFHNKTPDGYDRSGEIYRTLEDIRTNSTVAYYEGPGEGAAAAAFLLGII